MYSKYSFKADVRAILSCISFQGALEELREELQVYRTEKISFVCENCLQEQIFNFKFHTACNIPGSIGRHWKHREQHRSLRPDEDSVSSSLNCNMYFVIFFIIAAWLVSVLEANGCLRGMSSMLVVDNPSSPC